MAFYLAYMTEIKLEFVVVRLVIQQELWTMQTGAKVHGH